MSLNPMEAQEAYESLIKIAKESGLDWLVEDVESQIRSGKQGTKKIQVEISTNLPERNYLEKRKSRTAAFVVTESYTNRDKLLILVDAIEAASCGLSIAVLETVGFLDRKLNNFASIEFAPDIERGKVLRVEKDFRYKEKNIHHLSGLLRELREAI